MKTVVVIPSRLGSSRFPNKPLAKIDGREMILHVCDRVASGGYELYVATPDMEIFTLCVQNGYTPVLTLDDCMTGTDRVASAVEFLRSDADIIVNVQGDEPFVRPSDIAVIVNRKEKYYNAVIGSMCRLTRNGPNVVKVNQNAGVLMELTREGTGRYAQCGLCAFTRDELNLFYKIPDQEKELSLKKNANIELMRFVEMGYPVRMVEIMGSPSVDAPSDIKYIQEVMKNG